MAQAYDWQAALKIPEHDEPEADKKLQAAMEQAVERLRHPWALRPAPVLFIARVVHPDSDAEIMSFPTNLRSWDRYNVPLRVEVFPQDTVRRRRRTYLFKHDGMVIVERQRDVYGERSEGPETVEAERLQGWPQGVRHLFRHMAEVMRASARWELELAESLEVMAFEDGDVSRYERGKRDGGAGLSPTDATLAYLKGYAEGREQFILNNPAMR